MASVIDDHHSDEGEGESSGHRGHDHDAGGYTLMRMNPNGKAHCFDPLGRDDVKYEEYGRQDAPEQWNENGSICRASDEIESQFDEDEAEDEDQKNEEEEEEEDDEDQNEGEAIVGTNDERKQNRENDGDEQQGGFVYRGLHARFNGEHGGQRKNESLLKFPPCLPSLVRARHLPCQTPSVVLKSYRSNGRLVIKKEVKEVQHREYFHAVRSNGRLTLYLVKQDAEAAPSSPN